MTPNPYDQAARYLAKLEPLLFLAWLLRLTLGQFRFHRWIDARQARFPGEPDRTCDTVAWLEDVNRGGVPWAVPLEFQIEPDFDMFGRALGYLGTLWLTERPSEERGDRFEVGALIVNLTGKGRTSRKCDWPEAGMLTHLGVVERDMASEDAAANLKAIEKGEVPAIALPLIPLMQGGGEAGNIQTWLTLASADEDARRRADYGGLALVFAEAGGCHDEWKKALGGWNVVQSKQVLEWQQQARTEGRKEGRTEGTAETLLDVLKARHKNLSEELCVAVRAITDEARLRSLVPLAVQADTLEQFRRDAGL